jgi:hypothetical protein
MDGDVGAKTLIELVVSFSEVDEDIGKIVVFAEFGIAGGDEELF